MQTRNVFIPALALAVIALSVYAGVAFAAIGYGSVETTAVVGTAGPTLSIDAPSGTSAGNVLIASMEFQGGTTETITPPPGWLLLRRTDSGTSFGVASYYKVAGGSESATYAWSFSPNTRALGGIVRYSGVDVTNPIDLSSGTTGTSATPTGGAVTTTQPNDLVIGIFADGAAQGQTPENFTPPTGMTERFDITRDTLSGAELSMSFADALQASAGTTGAKIATTPTSDAWVAQTIALREAVPTATLTVVKHVVNSWGGTLSSSDFTVRVTQGGVDVAPPAAGSESGTAFSSLAPGLYTVTEDAPPSGYAEMSITGDCDSNGNITLTSGSSKICTITNSDVAGSITVVKNTAGGDGTFNFSGEGLPDFAITTSDRNGTYTIGDLSAGTYSISETIPSGWDLSSAYCDDGQSSTNGSTISGITVPVGGNITCTFSDTKRANLTVQKIADPNSGSFQFDLTGPAQTGVPGQMEFDPSGVWHVGDLLPDSYNLLETILAPQDWTGTQQIACSGSGDNDPQGSVASPGFGFTLHAGEGMTCVVNNTQDAIVTGKKFEDIDADGPSVGDPGLSGWTITATPIGVVTDGPSIETLAPLSAITDEDGNYTLRLQPGEYRVCETLQSGWVQTYPAAGMPCDGELGYDLVLGAGANVNGKDFGNYQEGSISGYKWDDANGNGKLDEGERTLSGWTIDLLYDDHLRTAVTDEGGRYAFDHLAPGSYMVREEGQAGWAQTHPLDPATYTVHLASGQVSDENDFGNQQRATVEGYKWSDLNRDGIWQSECGVTLRPCGDEPGIPGWTITATPVLETGAPDQARSATSTITDQNGRYLFTFTPENFGAWQISETPSDAWRQTFPTDPSLYAVTVGPGTALEGENFGNWESPQVQVAKWNDANGDGAKGDNESMQAGWGMALGLVEATDTPSVIDVQIVAVGTTDSSGVASLRAPGAGTYVVLEENRGGWSETYPAVVEHDPIVLTRAEGIPSAPEWRTDAFYSVSVSGTGSEIITRDNSERPRDLLFGNKPPAAGAPAPETPPASGGSNGPILGSLAGGGSAPGTTGAVGGGEVLGAATSTPGTCGPLLASYLVMGGSNDIGQVRKLQTFLNDEVGTGIPITGFYGPRTRDAVSTFQIKYWQDVLAPWVPFGLPTDHTPTGAVYKTTLWKINAISCPSLGLTAPAIP